MKTQVKAKTFFLVFFIHLILIFSFFFNGNIQKIEKKQKFKIKDVIVKAPPPPKNIISKKKTKKKIFSPPSPKKIIRKKKNTAVLSKLHEALSQLEKQEDKKKSDLFVPKSILSLQIDSKTKGIKEVKKEDLNYHSLLIEELKTRLHFPDFGEVKIKLVIDANGIIKDIKIIESKSEKNCKYLKKSLPQLVFPWFNLYSSKEKEITILFKNEKHSLTY
jgi:hypothetical protein